QYRNYKRVENDPDNTKYMTHIMTQIMAQMCEPDTDPRVTQIRRDVKTRNK
ncbi:hypothetical protein BgiMline_030333, partial [Biomphalaria glabrata]